MKRRIFLLSIILFFFLMLLFPRPVFNGASEGLLLWFQVVLPTLLPFIILTNLMINTHAIDWIARITGPVFCRIFHVSGYGSFAVLTGFLCGYPMGSKVTADLLRAGHISTQEGKYLLSFCNNTSPMFIISYLLFQNLKNKVFTFPAIAILMLSPVICSFLFRKYYALPYTARTNQTHTPDISVTASQYSGSIIDTCIMNGFETITKVGGYIMLFSILGNLISECLVSWSTLPFHLSSMIQHLLIPSMEITNGITTICSSNISESTQLLFCLSMASFGGWCSVAQTRCMIQGTGLTIGPYIIEKLITTLVTSLLACVYLFYFFNSPIKL